MDKRYHSGKCEIESRADGKPMIVGYGAVFYRANDPGTEYKLPGGARERIAPTAFDKAMAERADVLGLFNHERSSLLGRTSSGTMRLSVDERGLRYEIDLPDTQLGRDVAEHVRRGDITGSSFSFRADKDSWRRLPGTGEVRTLESVTLGDVGPVTEPAYAATTVAVRSEGDCREATTSLAAWQHAQRQRRLRELYLASTKSA